MPSAPVSLLLVDDDPVTIRVIGQMLAEYPDQRFAKSGEEALALARALPPDLILLDANMPGMTGFEVCEWLQADAVLAKVPVIFVTGHDAPALQADALKLGASDYVTKPLNALQLRARVRSQLRARQRVKDLQALCRDSGELPDTFQPVNSHILMVTSHDASVVHLNRILDDVATLHFSATGESACQFASTLMPALIVLDTYLPEAEIFRTLASLATNPASAHTSVVLLTRTPNPAMEQRALDLGAADFVPWPSEPGALRARVANLMASARRADAEICAIGQHWQVARQLASPMRTPHRD